MEIYPLLQPEGGAFNSKGLATFERLMAREINLSYTERGLGAVLRELASCLL